MIASSTPTGDGRWPIALRAAISTAIPVAVGWAAGNVGSGLIATLGAFTSRFGSGRPYLNRGVQLAVVAVALAAAVAVGSWAAQVTWFGMAVVSAVAVAAVWLCNALAVGPPGAYVFALAARRASGVSAAHLEPWQVGCACAGRGRRGVAGADGRRPRRPDDGRSAPRSRLRAPPWPTSSRRSGHQAK